MTKKEILQKIAKDFALGIPKRKYTEFPEKKDKIWKFVIQQHDANRSGRHWDIRLGDTETNTGYSFFIKKSPPKIGERVLARKTFDHNLSYFPFQGKIEKGYGAGKVKRYYLGDAYVHQSSPDKVSFSLDGKSKHTLVRMKDKNWLLIKSKLKKEAEEKSTLLDKVAGNPVNKRYWQMLKRLHGGTESTMKELSKTKDFGVYHGTAKKSLDNIMKEGLNPSLAGYGRGVFLGSKNVARGYSMNDNRSLLRLKYPNELKKGENYPSIKNFVTNQKNIPKNIKTYKDKNLYKTYGIQNSGDKTYATSVGVMRSKKNIPSKYIKEIPLEKPKPGEWKLGNNSVGMNKINPINKGQNLISSTIQQAKTAEAQSNYEKYIDTHTKRRAVRVFLEDKNGKYLFQKALTDLSKHRLPGGGIEKGETPKQTLIREMKEEFNIDPKVSKKAKFLGKFMGSEYVFYLKDHGLKPGVYQASNNPEEVNTLVRKKPKGKNYWGPDPKLFKLAEDLKTAKTLADDLIKKHLRRHAYKISVVGSIARKHDQVNDIDVVMWPKKSFNEYSDFIGQSGKKVMKFDYEGMPVNLFIADKKSYEPTRYHFSRGKGIIQDKIKAREKGYKLTRYGLQDHNTLHTKEKKIKAILQKN